MHLLGHQQKVNDFFIYLHRVFAGIVVDGFHLLIAVIGIINIEQTVIFFKSS
jgi:hypothetical protein